MDFRYLVESYVQTEQMLNEMKPETRRKAAGLLTGLSIAANSAAMGRPSNIYQNDLANNTNVQSMLKTSKVTMKGSNKEIKAFMNLKKKEIKSIVNTNNAAKDFYSKNLKSIFNSSEINVDVIKAANLCVLIDKLSEQLEKTEMPVTDFKAINKMLDYSKEYMVGLFEIRSRENQEKVEALSNPVESGITSR